MTDSRPQPYLLTLDQIDGEHFALVGGKAFRLAMLKQHHFNVPNGLILTASLFETHLKHCRLIPLWAGSPDVAVTTESLEWLANTLKTTPLEAGLLQQLNQQLTALFVNEANNFAVRSSAIDEDQSSHTFAGIHLTDLGVPRLALPIAITRCWASALSQPAVQYRLKHSMSIQKIQIAVIIQPMLTPDRAGVGFTRNPLTGDRRELIIEADWGLGQAVVGGQNEPYFYRLENHPPDFPVLEQRVPYLSEKPSPLPPSIRAELAGQLTKIEALMNEPQDVEWAIQNEQLYFLQARPIPVLPPHTPPPHLEWTRGSHPEFLPELPSPLFGSILTQAQQQALTFFTELGLNMADAGPYVKLILGRPYLNLTLLKQAVAQVGLNPGGVLHTISHTEPGARGNRLQINWQRVWQARHILWRVVAQFRWSEQRVAGYNTLVDDIEQVLADPNFETDSARQVNQLRQQPRAYRRLFAANLPLAGAISALTALSSWLLMPFAKNPATVVSGLALKNTHSAARQLNQDLLTAARQIQPNESLSNALRAAAIEPLAATPPELAPILTPLLQKYGDHAVYDADLGQPRYREDPAPLLRTMWQYVQSNYVDPPQTNRSAAGPDWGKLYRRGNAINRILPWRLGVAVWLVGLLRRLLLSREALNRGRGRAMTACRRWDLALGKFWVNRGWLNQPHEIFWLTLDEIERALLIGAEAGHALSAIVAARRDTYQTYADTDMPYHLSESQIAHLQLGIGLAAETEATVMMGLPISPGQVQGTVQVWTASTHSFKHIPPHTILVLPSTDPAFLPLLHLVDGLIVEKGGLLSHGSVIAREYGLPAVANIAGAVKRLRTGDRVLIDGSTGIVQIL
jgi:phosphohistidine swiveling domain-containing protein